MKADSSRHLGIATMSTDATNSSQTVVPVKKIPAMLRRETAREQGNGQVHKADRTQDRRRRLGRTMTPGFVLNAQTFFQEIRV